MIVIRTMLSLVENISSILKPLETRAVDAHIEEKHLDIYAKNKGRKKKNSGNTNINEDDFTTISVKGVILFLEDFLEARLNINLQNNETEQNQNTIKPWLRGEQSNDTPPQKAANAYAHAAKVSRISVHKVNHNSSPELKSIYTLIKDLRHLQDYGIKYLNIGNSEPLINAVITAVKLIKSKL